MAEVVAVARSEDHRFSKTEVDEIRLIAGVGVEGDCHGGTSVQHLSRIARDPTQPNLRQVHLIHEELFEELRAQGFDIQPGAIGENVTTRGADLLGLPEATRLRLGETAVVEITGVRNPCVQLDRYQEGLMQAVLERRPDGTLIRKAGVMAIVVEGGVVRAGDAIRIELPTGERRPRARSKLPRQHCSLNAACLARPLSPRKFPNSSVIPDRSERSEARTRDPGDWNGYRGSRTSASRPVSWIPGRRFNRPRPGSLPPGMTGKRGD